MMLIIRLVILKIIVILVTIMLIKVAIMSILIKHDNQIVTIIVVLMMKSNSVLL